MRFSLASGERPKTDHSNDRQNTVIPIYFDNNNTNVVDTIVETIDVIYEGLNEAIHCVNRIHVMLIAFDNARILNELTLPYIQIYSIVCHFDRNYYLHLLQECKHLILRLYSFRLIQGSINKQNKQKSLLLYINIPNSAI